MAIRKLFIATALTLLLAAPFAHASLIGTKVTLVYEYGTDTYTDVMQVGSGAEITCTSGSGSANVCTVLNADTQTIDIGDYTIRWDYTGNGTSFTDIIPNTMTFELNDPGFSIASIEIISNLLGQGLEETNDLSFTGSSVTINMTAVTVLPPTSYFELTLNPTAVPAPAAFWLFGSGLLALIGAPKIRERSSRRR